MTVHLILSLLALGLVCWVLRSLARPNEGVISLSWMPLAMAVVVILPLAFGPIIPLSHFVFEATSDNITWYVILDAALWLLAGFFLWRCIQQPRDRVGLTVLGTIWAIMGFWYGLGVKLSEYEPGRRTPLVTDAKIYLIQWASVHLVLLGLFFLLAFNSSFRRSWLRYTVTGLLFVLYLMQVIGGIQLLVK